jgi:amino acid transporter
MGDLAIQVGNALLLDNGFVLMLVFAFAVMVALFGAMLTATNNGVRISFSMSLDADVPDLLGALHPKYATPYFSVVIISVVSAVIGSAGILGGLPALMGIILAANIGAFMLYAILCLLTVTAFTGSERFNWLRHGVLPVTGIIANVGMAALAIYFGISTGGVAQQASLVALGMLGLWLLLNLVYFFFRKK